MAAAISLGGNVRVGLEDNLYIAPGQLARSNGELVAKAAELVSMIEPNIVIPMHYELPGLKLTLDPLEKFLKEMGATDAKRESSFKATSADSLPEETEVVVLAPKE